MKAKALIHTSDKQSIIKEIEITENEHLIEIESLYSLVSIGTERLVAKGLVPEELYQDMSVPYQRGDFDFPIQYGYSLVGKVVTKDHELNGQVVHLLHPHQDRCWVKAESVSVVPKGITPEVATLASNMETAVNAIWDGRVMIGERVLIVGFGIIGALVASVAKSIAGTAICIVEQSEERKQLAEKLGFQVLEDVPNDFDVAFHCSRSAGGLQLCINSVGYEGRIVELSWYGIDAIEVKLGGSFHHQRKQIISSQVAHIPTLQSHRWNYKRRKALVFELLKMPVFMEMITDTISFKETPFLFEKIRNEPLKGLGYCIKYGG